MRSTFRRFASDRQGNFALMMAILSVPVTMSIGLALDVSQIHHSRAALQQALDAAALAVAREGVTVSDSAALKIAGEFLQSNFNGTSSNIKVTRLGTRFTVTADALSGTSFGGLFGYKDWPINGTSVADIALTPYEIALVLDTTGSMAGGKLASMKSAVLGLVDTMSANVTDKDNLKFAMVPFAQFVNVGPQFAPKFDKKGRVVKKTGAQWLDIEGDSEVSQLELKKGISRFEVFHNLGVEWAGCVETREPSAKVAFDVSDAAPGKKAETLFVPALSIDEPAGGHYQNDYITSSVDPLDKTLVNQVKKLAKYGILQLVDPLTGGLGTELLPVDTKITEAKGPNRGCTTQPIVPLSTDYSGIKTKVEALAASGNTNIMEGVSWGWRVLSPSEPFTEGAATTSRARKIMIVLTDGANVFGVRDSALGSSYTSFGFAADQRLMTGVMTETSTNTAMNEKTLATCANAKKDGVEVFTIRLEEPDKTTGMMLKECASGEDHFFDAPSRSQLDEVFGQIRDKITQVRISS